MDGKQRGIQSQEGGLAATFSFYSGGESQNSNLPYITFVEEKEKEEDDDMEKCRAREVEEHFTDAEVLGYCECGSEISEGNEVYQDTNTKEYFCCQDCALKSVGFTQYAEIDGICECCGSIVSDEFESVLLEGDSYCDEDCLLKELDIEEIIA